MFNVHTLHGFVNGVTIGTYCVYCIYCSVYSVHRHVYDFQAGLLMQAIHCTLYTVHCAQNKFLNLKKKWYVFSGWSCLHIFKFRYFLINVFICIY